MTESEQEIRHERRRRFKRFLRPLPRRANIHRYPILKIFTRHVRKRPYLWSFRQEKVSVACYAGSILAMLPLYGFQIPLALLAAVAFRANLPVMVAIQFIPNPVTMVPIYLTTHRIGSWLIEATGFTVHGSRVGAAAYALVVGGIFLGLALGFVLDLVYRFVLYEKRIHSQVSETKPDDTPRPNPPQKTDTPRPE
jgi:uncharacterized protein (DUF2062 family)